MTLKQAQEMLFSFGIKNDNFAVFLSDRITDLQLDAIRLTLAYKTDFNLFFINKTLNEMETILKEG
jgi:precorrin-3B methylase